MQRRSAKQTLDVPLFHFDGSVLSNLFGIFYGARAESPFKRVKMPDTLQLASNISVSSKVSRKSCSLEEMVGGLIKSEKRIMRLYARLNRGMNKQLVRSGV